MSSLGSKYAILENVPWPLTVPEYTTSLTPLPNISPKVNLPSLTGGSDKSTAAKLLLPVFLYDVNTSPFSDWPLNIMSSLPSESKSTNWVVPSLTETKFVSFSSKYTSIGWTTASFSSSNLLFSYNIVWYPSNPYPEIRKSKSESLSISPKSKEIKLNSLNLSSPILFGGER